jgi:hypothetical protein
MSKTECTYDNQASLSSRTYFTPDQANKALVLVRRIVSDIVTGYQKLIDLQEILDSAQRHETRDHCESVRKDLIGMVEKLQSCLDELDDLGVDLRDWASGVVSFPSRFDGREICLNWQHGESAVAYWHEIDEEFGSRRPLPSLLMEQVAASAGR